MIRNLADFNNWKGNKIRVFTLYFSLPLLQSRLPRASYLHLILFIDGYKLLLKPYLYAGEIDKAEKKLLKFYNDIGILYHNNFCKIKLHYLNHVCHSIRDIGPLENYSTDKFDPVNVKISRSNNAKYQVEKHLILKYQKYIFIANSFRSRRFTEGVTIDNNSQYDVLVQELLVHSKLNLEECWETIPNSFYKQRSNKKPLPDVFSNLICRSLIIQNSNEYNQ
jgi:hypothetical protein